MIDPFDSEFISQELRDAWRKIEQLEEENRELKEELDFYHTQDELEIERKEYYDEFSDDWGRE